MARLLRHRKVASGRSSSARTETLEDFSLFLGHIRIRTLKASRGWVEFDPRSEQVDVLAALVAGDNIAVVKPRRIGVSTAVMAYVLWRFCRAAWAGEPFGILVVANSEATVGKVLYPMLYSAWERLPAWLRPPLSRAQHGEYMEAQGGSGAFIDFRTAGAKGGPARGSTTHLAWISEYAFCEEQDELKSAIWNAVPLERGEGQIIIESTPHYHGDGLHREVIAVREREARGAAAAAADLRALPGPVAVAVDDPETDANLVVLFFPWLKHAEYTRGNHLANLDDSELDDEEKKLRFAGATSGQLRWRRAQLARGMTASKFRRDYPLTIEDAYSQGENAYYRESDFDSIRTFRYDNVESKGRVVVLEPWDEDDNYAMGVDTATGAGRNWSVAYVVSKLTGNPVAIVRSNTIVVTDFAKVVITLTNAYRVEVVLCENNHQGALVNMALVAAGFERRLYTGRDGKMWTTHQGNRHSLFETTRDHIVRGNIDVLDEVCLSELRSLTVDVKDRIVQPEDDTGSHCDSACAFGMALIARQDVRMPKRRERLVARQFASIGEDGVLVFQYDAIPPDRRSAWGVLRTAH